MATRQGSGEHARPAVKGDWFGTGCTTAAILAGLADEEEDAAVTKGETYVDDDDVTVAVSPPPLPSGFELRCHELLLLFLVRQRELAGHGEAA